MARNKRYANVKQFAITGISFWDAHYDAAAWLYIETGEISDSLPPRLYEYLTKD